MNDKSIIRIAAWSGALSVALGAFGAHGLESMAESGKIDNADLHTFETAVRYQFYHTFALMAVGLLHNYLSEKSMRRIAWLFIAGMLIFSGSLYLLTFSPVLFGERMGWFGAITPLGGLSFIAGWIMLALQFRKSR
ncbi:MAG TPA: DUF423 domain-containing protein [Chitinophagales bacterium]|nr:DUF423 domain-containing protein [Chitinophagales bacterium]HNJ89165.1 DUF423 domain-containing protein [Chitinophagales bacterium]HNK98189.1 DUF423 domain-containing protein [Chitinophagales bacterium]HNM29955.1 DUF423 domain-containing protein [Chitinophagales bacterium]